MEENELEVSPQQQPNVENVSDSQQQQLPVRTLRLKYCLLIIITVSIVFLQGVSGGVYIMISNWSVSDVKRISEETSVSLTGKLMKATCEKSIIEIKKIISANEMMVSSLLKISNSTAMNTIQILNQLWFSFVAYSEHDYIHILSAEITPISPVDELLSFIAMRDANSSVPSLFISSSKTDFEFILFNDVDHYTDGVSDDAMILSPSMNNFFSSQKIDHDFLSRNKWSIISSPIQVVSLSGRVQNSLREVVVNNYFSINHLNETLRKISTTLSPNTNIYLINDDDDDGIFAGSGHCDTPFELIKNNSGIVNEVKCGLENCFKCVSENDSTSDFFYSSMRIDIESPNDISNWTVLITSPVDDFFLIKKNKFSSSEKTSFMKQFISVIGIFILSLLCIAGIEIFLKYLSEEIEILRLLISEASTMQHMESVLSRSIFKSNCFIDDITALHNHLHVLLAVLIECKAYLPASINAEAVHSDSSSESQDSPLVTSPLHRTASHVTMVVKALTSVVIKPIAVAYLNQMKTLSDNSIHDADVVYEGVFLFIELIQSCIGKGTIDRFNGDNILVTWNATTTCRNHFEHMTTSISLLRHTYNEGHSRIPLYNKLLSVGCSEGLACCGSMGTEKTRSRNIIGTPVKAAVLLCGLASAIQTNLVLSLYSSSGAFVCSSGDQKQNKLLLIGMYSALESSFSSGNNSPPETFVYEISSVSDSSEMEWMYAVGKLEARLHWNSAITKFMSHEITHSELITTLKSTPEPDSCSESSERVRLILDKVSVEDDLKSVLLFKEHDGRTVALSSPAATSIRSGLSRNTFRQLHKVSATANPYSSFRSVTSSRSWFSSSSAAVIPSFSPVFPKVKSFYHHNPNTNKQSDQSASPNLTSPQRQQRSVSFGGEEPDKSEEPRSIQLRSPQYENLQKRGVSFAALDGKISKVKSDSEAKDQSLTRKSSKSEKTG